MKNKIICRVLTGPTASGKTKVSLELAEKNGWDILCMDSMQIYRRMNIGTAKPTAEERARVPHYMLDICETDESFSVAAYRERAEALVKEKWQKEGREVLFVGGTGLYLQAMMHPMGMGQIPADEKLREEMNRLAVSVEGRQLLHRILESLDPETASRLPVNDTRRIIRAIEVTKGTGIPFSRQPVREEKSEFCWKVAALELPRDILYERINRRVEDMIRAGLADEVRDLLKEGIAPNAQSMQGIGYKEMIPYISNEWTLEKAVDAIKKGTRHYAKRQETFLRRLENVDRVDALTSDIQRQTERILM